MDRTAAPDAPPDPAPPERARSPRGLLARPGRADGRELDDHGAVDTPVVTIRAGRRRPTVDWREILRYRDLLLTLAWRDVRVRYKQTALGVTWVILQPLLASVVLSFVFSIIAGMRSGTTPYLLVTFAGLLAWNLFSSVVIRASSALVINGSLVTKVYFPRELLPLSSVVPALLDFVVGLVVMAALMVGFRAAPGAGLLLLPAWLAIVVLMALGLGLMAAALTVRYRDVQQILPFALSLGLYASPVAWTVAAVPARYRLACALNPLSGPIEAFRWSLLGIGEPDASALAYGAATALAVFWAGAWTFRRMEGSFADVL
ncbi:MAG TPA: ABC transporter permease [Isosphaeraceae bacterium]